VGFDINGLLQLLSSRPAQEERAILGLSRENQAASLQGMAEDIAYKVKAKAEIARVLAAEAASEGRSGMIAVANTIGNRAKDSGRTLMDEVSAKNQYYGYTAENKEKLYKQVKADADKIADNLVEGRLRDTTGGAKYFLLPTEKVRGWHGDKTVSIGKHTFYKEAKRK
jgi:spore germination cell wall hydrolase CwlJ-like protein